MQAVEERTKGADFGKAKSVFDVRKLEAEGKQGNGEAQIRPLRPSASVGIKINRAKGVTRQLTLRALTDEQVVELRSMRRAGTSWRLLGLHFGLHQSVAKRVAIGETYKEIPL